MSQDRDGPVETADGTPQAIGRARFQTDFPGAKVLVQELVVSTAKILKVVQRLI